MGTTILSFEDRVVIETLHYEKHSLQYIADYLVRIIGVNSK